MHHPTDRITHNSRGALAGTRNSSMGDLMASVSKYKPLYVCGRIDNVKNIYF